MGSGRVPGRTPDRHLPQRTVSTMRHVVTDYDNSKNHIPPGRVLMPHVEEADPDVDRRCFIVRDANG